jgi:hypothetical protein
MVSVALGIEQKVVSQNEDILMGAKPRGVIILKHLITFFCEASALQAAAKIFGGESVLILHM